MINNKYVITCRHHNSFVAANKGSLGLLLNPLLGWCILSFIHKDTCRRNLRGGPKSHLPNIHGVATTYMMHARMLVGVVHVDHTVI